MVKIAILCAKPLKAKKHKKKNKKLTTIANAKQSDKTYKPKKKKTQIDKTQIYPAELKKKKCKKNTCATEFSKAIKCCNKST